MDKKYELTEESIYVMYCETFVHRIKALKDFSCHGKVIMAGELGGYIESEKNLSQKGDCWVFDGALVCHDARVRQNAAIYVGAAIAGDASVFGEAEVGNAYIFGDAKISGNSSVFDAVVCEKARVRGNAVVRGDDSPYYDEEYGYWQYWCTKIPSWAGGEYGEHFTLDEGRDYGFPHIDGNAEVCGNAIVSDCADIKDNAKIRGDAKVSGSAMIYEDATISGHAEISAGQVHGKAKVSYSAKMRRPKDISEDRTYDNID